MQTGYLKNNKILVEVQVDFLGTDVTLKLVIIWNLFSHDGFRTWSKLFILKVKPICTHFLDSIHFFAKAQHAYLGCFSIAKGLATCRLGGVISTQKVLF